MAKNRNTFYFDHDYTARNDGKILELRAEFGWEGYGIFWAIIESICENNGFIESQALAGLSLGLSLPKETLKKVLDFCISVGLLIENDGKISNKRINDHLIKRQSLRVAGASGGRGNKKPPFSHPLATLKAGEERRGEESIGKDNKKGGQTDSFEQQQMRTALEANQKYHSQSIHDHEWHTAVARATGLPLHEVLKPVTAFHDHINSTYEFHPTLAKWRSHCVNWIKMKWNPGQQPQKPSGKVLKHVG